MLPVQGSAARLSTSRENATRNSLPVDCLPVALPDQVEQQAWSQQADVVIANILAGPLIELSGTLLQFLKPGGTLLLSGLLHSQAEALCSHYADRIALHIAGERDDWVCLRGQFTQK